MQTKIQRAQKTKGQKAGNSLITGQKDANVKDDVTTLSVPFKDDADILDAVQSTLSGFGYTNDVLPGKNEEELIGYEFWNKCIMHTNYLSSGNSVLLVPTGTLFFKGIPDVECENIKRPNHIDDKFQHKPMWMSTFKTARTYSPNKIWAYKTKRPLVLLNITVPHNIHLLLKQIDDKKQAALIKLLSMDSKLSPEENVVYMREYTNMCKYEEYKKVIKIATGYGVTLSEQQDILRARGVKVNETRFIDSQSNGHDQANVLNRVSYFDIDAELVEILKEEYPFLDGYYGGEIISTFHRLFHREVCIFGSNGKLAIDFDRKKCGNPTVGGKKYRKKTGGSEVITIPSTTETELTEAEKTSSVAYNNVSHDKYIDTIYRLQRSYLCVPVQDIRSNEPAKWANPVTQVTVPKEKDDMKVIDVEEPFSGGKVKKTNKVVLKTQSQFKNPTTSSKSKHVKKQK
jgi:hypothetical protein